MALFKYFSRDAGVPKLASSLTQKEEGVHVVSDFDSKAEKEAQCVGVTLHTQSKHNV